MILSFFVLPNLDPATPTIFPYGHRTPGFTYKASVWQAGSNWQIKRLIGVFYHIYQYWSTLGIGGNRWESWLRASTPDYPTDTWPSWRETSGLGNCPVGRSWGSVARLLYTAVQSSVQNIQGARCSSVVRAFTHGAMGRRIDPSWVEPTELCLIPASAPRLV